MGEIEKRVLAEERLGEIEYQQLQKKYNQIQGQSQGRTGRLQIQTPAPMSYANVVKVQTPKGVSRSPQARPAWQRGGKRTRRTGRKKNRTRKH
jgi:hypothetical protein